MTSLVLWYGCQRKGKSSEQNVSRKHQGDIHVNRPDNFTHLTYCQRNAKPWPENRKLRVNANEIVSTIKGVMQVNTSCFVKHVQVVFPFLSQFLMQHDPFGCMVQQLIEGAVLWTPLLEESTIISDNFLAK
ncbi:uncharacterized protein [Elaeis guineensis]|uniref:uncharacterized protein n=1 Tax=Elaeis guineensis var. tenera TaxID=51953 RepID=UPI003C6D9A85